MLSHAVCLDSSCRLYSNHRRQTAWLCGYDVPVGRTLSECSSCLLLSLSCDLAVSSHIDSHGPPQSQPPCLCDNHMQKGRCSGKVRGCWEWQLRDISHTNALRCTHTHRHTCPVPLSLCVSLPVCFIGMTVNINLVGHETVVIKIIRAVNLMC